MSGEQQAAPGTVERIRPRQLSQRDPAGLAKAIAESGFWRHIQTPAQAMVVLAAGEELGLTPLAACQGITIIEEKIGYTGNLIATLFKQHATYDYRVLESTNERCEVEFGPKPAPGRDEDGGWLPWPEAYGSSQFGIEDAKRAELVRPRSNWIKWPKSMCFYRCLTAGGRMYCPDLTAGTPIYTDEEIREVIHVESEAEVVEEDAAPSLPDDRVEHLLKGVELVKAELAAMSPQGQWLDGLNLLLGSIGCNMIGAGVEFAAGVAALTSEQADLLDAELQKLADQETPEDEATDAEPVEATHEGGEADVDA